MSDPKVTLSTVTYATVVATYAIDDPLRAAPSNHEMLAASAALGGEVELVNASPHLDDAGALTHTSIWKKP
ncbi:hypothetical protein CWO91_16665 [Bradyrhizobium genosp. SA-3]|uniref:hypothetical protein n=1 Tax=Bradyrhizobium genosp. SA-3 TaxID=508868 RepID=UPI00102A814A|nr:hypothetical protein [Bradyrhizobium genosp. SA-3]RZN09660.1 hypothetical protein CWO91_16665 [Bradyrhizobium genosp. SA-3]